MWQRFRQTLGRAFRETGQALDRLGVKTAAVATTRHDYYDDPVIYEDHLSRHRHQFPLLWSGRPLVHRDVAYLAPCSTLIGSVRIGKGSSVWYGAVLRADECTNAGSHKLTDLDGDEQQRRQRGLIAGGGGVDEETEEQKQNALELQQDDKEYDDHFQQLLKEEPWELSEDRYRDRTFHHGGGIFVGNNTNVQDNCIITARENHCRIGDGVTIGHLAQIHSATVEDFCLIGMGAIIKENAVVEAESFIGAGCVVERGQVVKTGELWVGNPARKLRDLSSDERKRLHYQSSEYVNVATGQHGVMELGGNVTEEMLLEAAAAKSDLEKQAEKEEEAAMVHEQPLKVETTR